MCYNGAQRGEHMGYSTDLTDKQWSLNRANFQERQRPKLSKALQTETCKCSFVFGKNRLPMAAIAK